MLEIIYSMQTKENIFHGLQAVQAFWDYYTQNFRMNALRRDWS